MLKNVLFDLDDTLLTNDMNQFVLNYMPLLAEHVKPLMDKERFMNELWVGTQAMISNTDITLTNREVFWSVFCERTQLDQDDLEPFVNRFYQQKFGQLKTLTARRPAAKEIVRGCFERGQKVVVATNPLFPRSAIEQRLAWAGVPVTEFDYALVTTYENMHSSKPHVTYYEEILAEISAKPDETLMVGDDWANDITPASQLGLATYWISEPGSEVIDPAVSVNDSGSLEALHARLATGWLSN